jgi:hypothetical protein
MMQQIDTKIELFLSAMVCFESVLRVLYECFRSVTLSFLKEAWALSRPALCPSAPLCHTKIIH